MNNGKVAKVFCFLGLLIIIIGLAGIIVALAVALKPEGLNFDDKTYKYLLQLLALDY
jgi:ABC-type lipoprotein release transport system permease subunit